MNERETMTDQVKGDKTMTKHRTGTHEQWLAARLELLKDAAQ